MGDVTNLLAKGSEIFRTVMRFDNWENVFTGLGTRARDKLMTSVFEHTARLTDQEYEDMFHGDFLARGIVLTLVEEAMGPGITYKRKTADGEEEATQEEIDQLTDALDKWDVRDKFVEAAGWGRLYGRGALYPVLSGSSQDSEVDLEDESLTMLDLLVLEKRDYSAFHLNDITLDPDLWILTTDDQATGTHIHHTRLVHFGGIRTSRRSRIRMHWADHSALHPVMSALRDHGMNWLAVVNRMQDASQGVFRLKGLFDMITGSDDGVANLKKRMAIVDMSRSVARALMLDADEESFEYQEVSFSGVPEIMGVSMQIVSAAAKMPMTKLFGVPPAGLGSEDISGNRNWNKRVEVYQQLEVLRPYTQLVNIVAQTEGLGRGWVVTLPSPILLTPSEESALRSTVANTDVAYIHAGVYLAEEVALARAQPNGFLNEVEVDLELREKLLQMSLDTKIEMAENPPTFGATDEFGNPIEQELDEDGNPIESDEKASFGGDKSEEE